MAFFILGALELISYFAFGIHTFEGKELFILIWGLMTVMLFIKSVFNLPTFDMNRSFKNGFVHSTDDIYKPPKIDSSLLNSIQYLLLVLVNVVLYIVIINPHY